MTRNVASAAVKKPSIAPNPDVPAAGRGAIAVLASDEAIPVASGAHDLQDLLARRLDEAPAANWSMRATLTFVLLVCGGFWAAVFFAVRMLTG